jgi:predicted TIM-barrel enzyme
MSDTVKIVLTVPVDVTFYVPVKHAKDITMDDLEDICRTTIRNREQVGVQVGSVLTDDDMEMAVVCDAWEDDYEVHDTEGDLDGIENRRY